MKKALLFLPILLLSCFEQEESEAADQPESSNSPIMALGPAGEPIHPDTVLVDSVHEESFCLPYPSEEFLKWKMDDDETWDFPKEPPTKRTDIIYAYLYLHLQPISEKTNNDTLDTYGSGPVVWHQEFENGIRYTNFEYMEIGGGGELYTQCSDKRAFLDVIAPVIYIPTPTDSNYYDPNNVWRDDSTRYVPFDEGVGCHYEIKLDSTGHYMMDWYCGC